MTNTPAQRAAEKLDDYYLRTLYSENRPHESDRKKGAAAIIAEEYREIENALSEALPVTEILGPPIAVSAIKHALAKLRGEK